jgi:hypothetical protein
MIPVEVNMKRNIALFVIALAALAPVVASADDDARKQRLEELKKRRDEARAKAREAQKAQGGGPGNADPKAASAGESQGGSTNQPEATSAKSGAAGSGGAGAKAADKEKSARNRHAELRRTRGERRNADVARFRERWGPLLENDKGRDELRQHARRVAQLQRIRAIAEEKEKVKVLESVDKLLTREEIRHSRAMNTLRESGAAAGKP